MSTEKKSYQLKKKKKRSGRKLVISIKFRRDKRGEWYINLLFTHQKTSKVAIIPIARLLNFSMKRTSNPCNSTAKAFITKFEIPLAFIIMNDEKVNQILATLQDLPNNKRRKWQRKMKSYLVLPSFPYHKIISDWSKNAIDWFVNSNNFKFFSHYEYIAWRTHKFVANKKMICDWCIIISSFENLTILQHFLIFGQIEGTCWSHKTIHSVSE